MARQYIAEHTNGRNHDPITSGSPRGVWNQLQKATGRDRKWLQDYGWRVKLDDGVRPEPVRPAPINMNPMPVQQEEPLDLAPYQIHESDPAGAVRWIVGAIIAGVVILIAVAIYMGSNQ